ncbi:MAG: HEAT repeat domain-containing protein [Cyclobacteriaceae bacterium]
MKKMHKEITDNQLIDLIEGSNNPELERAIEVDQKLKVRFEELSEVLNVIEKSKRVEVPAHIQMNVQQAILSEQSKHQSNFSWRQIAAAVVVLMVGFGLGKFSGSSGASSELSELRKEIQSLKEVTLTSSLKKYSASERILAVNKIEESTDQVNPGLIATLIRTLNSDESPNVRYAALQALTRYIDNTDVRTELVKSLESQSDPLIQISLITILTEVEEKSAIAPLKEIIENEQITPEVKKQAEIAIQVLI